MIGSAVPVIAGALVFLCLLAALAVGGAFYLWRWARRRYLVARAALRSFERAWTVTRTGRTLWGRWGHLAGTGAAGDPRTVPLPQLRRQMWLEVDQAGAAVDAATAHGAPVGDLPSLLGRLRETARLLDQLLVVPAPEADVRRQVADVRRTATAIRSAATATTAAVISDAAELRLRGLVADTDREVHSLAAGTERLTRGPS